MLCKSGTSLRGAVLFAFFLTLFSAPPLFASVVRDCCDLRREDLSSHPLLAHLSDIQVNSPFGNGDLIASSGSKHAWGGGRVDQRVIYDVPIVHNRAVTQQIDLYQTTFRAQIERGLARSGKYIVMMQEILMAFDLPLDLVYLALIESNFSVKAVSRAKAVGPWQFIRGTAKRYGLRVDEWIDERRDPFKATRAAAAYLKDLNGMFDSWLLSLASYNAGENRIVRAMAKTKAADFWELRASGELPRETQHYVPKFMAATMIAKNPGAYGFAFPEYEFPLRYDEVTIKQPTSLRAIARATRISLEEIEQYNPELRKGTTPPRYPNYRLKLPPGTKDTFLANQSKMEAPRQHRVKRGETISSIAKKYRVSMKTLLASNRLHKKSVLRVGRTLVIPNA